MKARIYRGTSRNMALLAARLARGEPVAVPTETVYGLAADATSPAACRRVFRAKGRPSTDPLIVHIARLADLPLVARAGPEALRLARAFWPGPLTLVLPKDPRIPDVVTAGRDSVAVRLPAHPLFRRLIRLAGRPLAAPSANPFGYVSPTTAAHVRDGLGGRIRAILDGGPCTVGLESTIVDLRDPARPAILRPGAVTRAQVARVLGRAVAAGPAPARRRRGTAGTSPAAHAPGGPVHRGGPAGEVAPGMLARHYSPRTPVVLHARVTPALLRRAARAADPSEAWLLVGRPRTAPGEPLPPTLRWLDDRGGLEGAARRLFSALRTLDGLGLRVIHAELARGGGLGDALNDRLRRAAARGR